MYLVPSRNIVSENEIRTSDIQAIVEELLVAYWGHFIAEDKIYRQNKL